IPDAFLASNVSFMKTVADEFPDAIELSLAPGEAKGPSRVQTVAISRQTQHRYLMVRLLEALRSEESPRH
ncbi:MAG: hypothetical protein M1608_16780, partial [Candidatus Omnitrophica bacterium]|nr:hypothetical protein [Candidatus Omnitrophota bacterium]